jgi:SNF2 family DNA or RNA helicase
MIHHLLQKKENINNLNVNLRFYLNLKRINISNMIEETFENEFISIYCLNINITIPQEQIYLYPSYQRYRSLEKFSIYNFSEMMFSAYGNVSNLKELKSTVICIPNEFQNVFEYYPFLQFKDCLDNLDHYNKTICNSFVYTLRLSEKQIFWKLLKDDKNNENDYCYSLHLCANKRIIQRMLKYQREFKKDLVIQSLLKQQEDTLVDSSNNYFYNILDNHVKNDKQSADQKYQFLLKDHVKLYNYQINDINWMKSIEENIDNGLNMLNHVYYPSYSINLKTFNGIHNYNFVLILPENIIMNEFNIKPMTYNLIYYGGNLISEMGLGKSLITLSHIFSKTNEYDQFIDNDIGDSCNYFYKRGIEKGNTCNKKIIKTGELYCDKHKKCAFIDKLNYKYQNLDNLNLNNLFINEKGNLKLKTNASLIICPTQLCDQWVTEYYDKFKAKKRVIIIVTCDQYQNLTIGDLLFADLVVISYKILINDSFINKSRTVLNHKSYNINNNMDPINFIINEKFCDINSDINSGSDNDDIDILDWLDHHSGFLKDKTLTGLQNFYWNSVYLDEYHEISSMNKNHILTRIIVNLSSKYKWNISGTPFAKGLDSMIDCLEYNTSFCRDEKNKINGELLDNCKILFRRNTKTSITNEYSQNKLFETIKLIEFNQQERLIYNSYSYSNSKKYYDFLIKLCCDPSIHEETATIIKNCKTFQEIQDAILNNNENKIASLKTDIEQNEELINIAQQELVDCNDILDIDTIKQKITNYKRSITLFKKELENINRTQDYLKNAIAELKTSDICPICLDDTDSDNLAVTKCGHKFCHDCITAFIDEKGSLFKCPKCNIHISKDDIFKLKNETNEIIKVENSDLTQLINSVKSSKLGNIIHYINTNLLENDKMIIFSQHDKLLKKLAENLNLKVLFCTGSVYQRKNAIKKFQKDSEYKIIMLSSENSASGINLTNANKIILIEPIYGDAHYRKDIESQAVGRADRLGRNSIPLEIIRFIVKDTIEEDIINQKNTSSIEYTNEVPIDV